MGCSVKTKEILDESTIRQIIKNIHDNLEANLVNQSTLNLELTNLFKKFDNKDNNNSEEILGGYYELLLNLTNISDEQEKADINNLLFSLMNMFQNNYFNFHVTIYRRLQGTRDYSNIKSTIERDLSLKAVIKRSKEILTEVFNILKLQSSIKISQLSRDKFRKACERRGVKMNQNQISGYYNLITMKPKDYTAVNENIRKELNEHRNIRKNMADNMDSFKTLMEEMLREGNHYTNVNLENFGAMCKKFDINLEAPDIEEIFNLMQKYYFDFFCYIDYINTKPIKYDEYLEMKAFKLDTISRIDSQPLPAVKKLPKFA